MAPGEMSAYWSQVFLCAGLHQACLRNHSGPVKDLKFGKNEQIYEYFGVIMFFRRVRAQREGRRYAHLRIKFPPEFEGV